MVPCRRKRVEGEPAEPPNARVPVPAPGAEDVHGLHERAIGACCPGHVRHLPAAEPVTARQFIGMVFAEAGKPPRMGVITRPMVLLAGLFSPAIRETAEVLYQFEHRFVMDTTKFEQAFGRRVTPHREAIRATLEWYRGRDPHGGLLVETSQWGKCDHFRYSNWPDPIPEDIPSYKTADYPAYQIERWRALATKEIRNPSFTPDGITLIDPLTQEVYNLIERPSQDRICAWFDVALCRREQVLLHVQDWGSITMVDMHEDEWARLKVPSCFVVGGIVEE